MSQETIRKVMVALAAEQDRLLSKKETSVITSLSYSTMWRYEGAGKFPKRRKKGPKSVGYLLSEVMAWMQSLEIVAEGTIHPVATPGDGKKRGRPSSKAETVKTAEAGVEKTAEADVAVGRDAVNKFKTKMRDAGLAPPNNIIADGRLHWVHGINEPLGWYIFDTNQPAVGLYGCQERKMSRKWAIKKDDALSDHEKEVLKEKLVRLRNVRDEVLKGEEGNKPAS